MPTKLKAMEKSARGFAHPELLLLLVILMAVGLVGYRVANRSTPTTSSTEASSQTAPSINNRADLEKAAATLSSQPIDSDLNPVQFNTAVSSLL